MLLCIDEDSVVEIGSSQMIIDIIKYSKSIFTFVIGQNESDNSRYLEAVALFQLLNPSACNNAFLDRSLVQRSEIGKFYYKQIDFSISITQDLIRTRFVTPNFY
jgi:hypothetical protein